MSYIDHLETLSKKQLMVLLARRHHEETQGIALVGMGCRLPGGIDDPWRLWAALRDGHVVPTRDVGPPRDSRGRPRWNLDAPDLAPIADQLRHGAFLSDVDLFDAGYFGIPDEEARHMDPQQRLLLEVTVAALADANLTRARLAERTVGVFAAAGQVEYPFAWLRNGLPAEELSPYMGTGSGMAALSGRIGMALGLRGPAISLETASSSMLTAVHLAAHALRRRECDIAVVGVCNLVLSPFSTAILGKAGMVSPSGRSRPFTAAADGHARGEGCGVVILKRQADARADGDRPYALIRGSAVPQHGDRPGMSVMPASGQRVVIDRALRSAGWAPHDVSYVEAQANGSKLGGVIEAEVLSQAYGRDRPGAPPLHVGSCKANLGYLETASGAPALMKTALTVMHGEVPRQPEADSADPGTPWARLGLRFAEKPVPWPGEGRRRAAVSGYGFAGTMAHVVLEDAEASASVGVVPGPSLLVLSAHRPDALAATARRLHEHLSDRTDWTVDAVCRTLAEGRDHLAVRAATVVADRDSLLAALTSVAGTSDHPPAGNGPPDVAPVGDLVVEMPDLAGAVERTGIAGLDHRIAARTDDGADRGALAWALGWFDLLRTTRIGVVGAVLHGRHRDALADVVTGARTADEVWADPHGGGAEARPPWRAVDVDHTRTLTRTDSPAQSVPVALDRLDPSGWLALVASRFLAGADLDLGALSTRPGHGLCRLPGPVLTGRSFWPDHNIWR